MTKLDAQQEAGTPQVASSDDFLDFLAQETFQYPLKNGKYAVIRSLSYAEVQLGLKEHRGNEMELSIHALKYGLVTPQLTEAQFEQVRQGRAGAIADLANRIMVISGMVQEEKETGSPLAGSGS